MTKYRKRLPQLGGRIFLTDGGIETVLIFQDGLELSHFAAFHLLRAARVARHSCATMSATSQSPRLLGSGSFSRVRPGGRARIGVANSAIRGTRSPQSIATPSR
jgi:hypothetical protein